MSIYEVIIPGNHNLKTINDMIAGEEAGASEFQSNIVNYSNNKLVNLCTFKTLPDGTIPKPLTIVDYDDPQPGGTKKVWTGAMMVKGENTAVAAYRKS